MPLITISLYPGRSQEQKADFAKAITKSAVVFSWPPKSLRMVIAPMKLKDICSLEGKL